MFLKQATAATVRIGPFLDPTDGVTEETALSLTSTDIQVSKAGAAFANKSDATAPAHDADGWYSCVLNSTDTGTVGQLILKSHSSAQHVPVWHVFYVVEEAIYDALLGASAAAFNASQQVVAASVAGDVDGSVGDLGATAVTTLEASVTGLLEGMQLDHIAAVDSGGNPVAGSYFDRLMDDGTATYDRTTDSLQAVRDRGDAAWDTATSVSIAAGGITSASFANNAITASAIAADAIGASELAADAVAEIQSGLSTLTQSQVNAELLDVLNVDTFTELTAVPGASATFRQMVGWMYAVSRNKMTQTATAQIVRNDADGANIGQASHSDDGTTLIRGKWA